MTQHFQMTALNFLKQNKKGITLSLSLDSSNQSRGLNKAMERSVSHQRLLSLLAARSETNISSHSATTEARLCVLVPTNLPWRFRPAFGTQNAEPLQNFYNFMLEKDKQVEAEGSYSCSTQTCLRCQVWLPSLTQQLQRG